MRCWIFINCRSNPVFQLKYKAKMEEGRLEIGGANHIRLERESLLESSVNREKFAGVLDRIEKKLFYKA